MAEILIENISKSFGDHTVLKDLSLTVRDGECFTLIGPSGCGKTVLLRIMAGFETLDAQQHGFAAPRGPYEGKTFAVSHREGQIPEHGMVAKRF